MSTFTLSLVIRAPAAVVWAFHELPDAMDRLTPPGVAVRVIRAAPSLAVGATAEVAVRIAPGLWWTWLARHTICEPPNRFVDVMDAGPFAAWEHQHRIRDLGNGTSELTDAITYRLRWWQRPGVGMVRRDLERSFAHRHAVTRAWCEAQAGPKPERQDARP